jgi:hypothetical protein
MFCDELLVLFFRLASNHHLTKYQKIIFWLSACGVVVFANLFGVTPEITRFFGDCVTQCNIA